MVIKGQGLTHSRHLCASCEHCMRRTTGVSTTYDCLYGRGQRITKPVEECSEYSPAELAHADAFYKTAYVLVSDDNGEKKFVTPEEYNGQAFGGRRGRGPGFI